MYILNGHPLSLDVAFVDANDIQRPANWLRLASPEEREAAGVEEVPDPPAPPDGRFYWGLDQDGNLIPKDLDQLKEQFVKQVKEVAASMLSQTDWYITRRAETQRSVPRIILDYRSGIRATCDQRESLIDLVESVEELAGLVTSDFTTYDEDLNRIELAAWPADPSMVTIAPET